MEKIKNFIYESIVNPLYKNIVLTMLISGLFAILFGTIIDEPKWVSETISKIGSAILGAGVFVAIVKSAQFVEIFQNHLYDVFYKPARIFNLENLKQKWILITENIIQKTLPNSHSDVSNRIMKQFLTSELTYHFSDYKTKYDVVTVEPQSGLATIIHTIRTTIMISPNQENPIFEQELSVNEDGGYCILKSLIINNKNICLNEANEFLKLEKNNKIKFYMPLNKYIKENRNGDKFVELERSYEITQNLISEPFFLVTIKRFVSGSFQVKAKIGDKYKFYFTKTGLDDAISNTSTNHEDAEHIDAEGFHRWTLSEQNDVLLPGQGFIIIISPNQISYEQLSCVEPKT